MTVRIPANTTATVYVPARSADEVTESGQPASQAEGVKFVRMESGAAVYQVGSGVYQFLSQKGGETAMILKTFTKHKEQ